jgi:hypothetical protein
VGRIIMNVLVKSLVLFLLISSSHGAYADGSHYNFEAKSNTDNIFLEKCKIYREILKTKNVELFKSFIDPALHEHPGLAKGFATSVKKYEREVGKEGYKLERIVIVDLKDQNFAGVDYIYSYKNGKGSGNSGCTFTRLEADNWKIR